MLTTPERTSADPPRVTGRHHNTALAQARRTKATELVLTGHSYQQVADTMGYASRGTVHRIVQDALKARQVESIDELRTLEADRLDALQRTYWDKAIDGDLRAASLVLKIMDQRAKLLGLYPVIVGTRRPGRHAGETEPEEDVMMYFGPDGKLTTTPCGPPARVPR